MTGITAFAGWDVHDGGVTNDNGFKELHNNNWAYLNTKGIAGQSNPGSLKTFPIIIGEFGHVFDSPYNATFRDELVGIIPTCTLTCLPPAFAFLWPELGRPYPKNQQMEPVF